MKNKKKVDFKESILNVNFETQTAPVIQEAMGKDFIEYGTENYRNLYPQFLIDLFYNSSTHSAIISTVSDMIAGESLTVEESDNLDAYVKLKRFLAQANSKGESLHSVVKKIAFDFKLQGAYALNVVWSKDRTEISDIYHIPVERIRMGKPDALGRVTEYYVSSDWSNTRKNKPQVVPAFNINDRTNPNAIIYDGMYSPNMQLYKVPDYVAGCNWCLIDQKIAEYHLANIENGFSASMFINFSNGVPSSEERRQVEKSIARKFEGSGNAGKTVITFSDDKNRTPEIVPISMSEADKTFLALQELMVSNIMVAHRVTSPMLMGIKNSTGLGNNAEELNSAFEVFLNSVIKPFQNNILDCLGKILEVNGINLPIEIVQNKPITTRFTIEDMKEVMTTDEIRSELGLKSLQEEELTADEEDKRQKYAKDEKCDCNNPKDCKKKCYKPNSKEIIDYLSNLEKQDEYEILDDYNLLEEEKAEDENHSYDFAVNTGVIDATGKEGKSNKDKALFKIRYVYRGGGVKENTRDFCRHMINNEYTSLFTREDITAMSTANSEFGTYNLFKYKGSYNCRHYWLRRLYVLKKAPREITIDGKVYQKGDYLPKDVKNYYPRNKGYVPNDAGVPAKNTAEQQAGKINDKVVK